MGPLSSMLSIVDGNVVMRRIPISVCVCVCACVYVYVCVYT